MSVCLILLTLQGQGLFVLLGCVVSTKYSVQHTEGIQYLLKFEWMNEWMGMHLYSGVLYRFAEKLGVRGIFLVELDYRTDLCQETSSKLWKCLKKS